MRHSRNFSFYFLASLLAATPLAAQDQAVCDDLHGRLADIREVIGTNRPSRQYSSAIAEQNIEIRQTANDMRDRGCSARGSAIADAENAAECDEMESALERMQDNLRYLTERRDEGRRNGGSDDVLRDQLLQALHENGCDQPLSADQDTIITNRSEPSANDEAPVSPEQQAMRTDTFIQPMDGSGGPSRGYDDGSGPQSYPNGGAYGQNIQTVCVRTCDGGFFPMTPNATPLNFQHDAETCAKMCPGVSTELFFHYLPNQESSEMVSASTGAPYSAMPYAFAYRKRAPGEKSACTCNLSAYYEEIRREKAISAPQRSGQPESSITTIETKKPQQPAPPVTAKTEPVQQQPDRPYDPSTAKVRQVGPQFMSSDQGTMDLKNPAIPGPQPEQ